MKKLTELKENKDYVVKLEKLKEGEKISVVSDAMFEVMINNEERLKYASYLIFKLFQWNNPKQLHLRKTEIDKEYLQEKGKRVDFVAEVGEELINIEMNNNASEVTFLRNFKYMSGIYQGKVRRGEEYRAQEKVIQINLNNFSYGVNSPGIETYQMVSDQREVCLFDNFQIVNIYLPEIRKKYYNKGEISDLEKMLLVMTERSIEEAKRIGKGNKIMEEYIKDSVEASRDDYMLGVYDKELEDEMLLNSYKRESYRKGIEEGINDNKRIIAKNMLEKDFETTTISEITGLSLEEVENLRIK